MPQYNRRFHEEPTRINELRVQTTVYEVSSLSFNGVVSKNNLTVHVGVCAEHSPDYGIGKVFPNRKRQAEVHDNNHYAFWPAAALKAH